MPIEMPVNRSFFVRSNFWLEWNTQTFESEFTRNTQTFGLGGPRWVMSVTLRTMRKFEAGPWVSFFLQCEGRANTFTAFDPERVSPLGPATGTPLVKGGSQVGSALAIDGCTANVIGWLRAGDFFSVGTHLGQLTTDANTDGSGETTLHFKPPIPAGSAPADNAPVTVQRPTCIMMLADDRQGEWDTDANGNYVEKTFTAHQVF